VIVYYLYLKTNIELNIGLCKMGRAGKQLGKRGNLGGENGGWFRGVGEYGGDYSPRGSSSATLSSPSAERGQMENKTLFPACGREGGPAKRRPGESTARYSNLYSRFGTNKRRPKTKIR
jgi:hypothetical protein